MEKGIESVRGELEAQATTHSKANDAFVREGHQWSERSQEIVDKVIKSRDSVKSKIKSDFAVSYNNDTILEVKTDIAIDCTSAHRFFADCNRVRS